MSAAAANRVQLDQFYIHIEGLPHRYTWQDLKDLIRPDAWHGVWAEMDREKNGVGYARIQRRNEALNLYAHLAGTGAEGRSLRVALWDVTKFPPRFMKSNFSYYPAATTSGPPDDRAQPDAVRPAAASNPWIHGGAGIRYEVPVSQNTSGANMGSIRPHRPSNDAQPGYRHHLGQSQQASQHQRAQQVPSRSLYQKPAYTTKHNGLLVNISHGAAFTEARGVFVNGISYQASEADIRRLFGQVGVVEECKLSKDPGGKSKGTATILYTSAQSARDAISTFHGRDWMDRQIYVRMDKDEIPRTAPMRLGSSTPCIVDGSNHGR